VDICCSTPELKEIENVRVIPGSRKAGFTEWRWLFGGYLRFCNEILLCVLLQ